MTKADNIFSLYQELGDRAGKIGLQTRFIREWAKEIGVSYNTIRNHWMAGHQIPEYIEERFLDWAVNWLQNAINLEKAKKIEVKSEIVK